MNNLIKFFVAATATVFIAQASAQTEVPNTFEAGGAAVAAEVNANFDALIDAIDALSEEIDALQAAAPTNLVAGRDYQLFSTWQFVEDQRTRTPNPNNTILFNFGTTEADLSFGTNGTATLGTETNIERDTFWDTTSGNPDMGDFNEESEAVNEAFDYTQDGGLVTVFIPDMQLEFYASKDGSILVANDYRDDPSEEGDDRYEGSSIILIEVTQ